MKDYYKYNRPEIAQLVEGSSKFILDVGCGEGNFASSLAKLGHRVWGIEPEEESAKVSESKCERVFNCLFEKFTTDEKFDYVVFNDVLEHMSDPWQVLLRSRNLLKNDGRIIASIPNFLYYWEFKRFLKERDFKYRESGVFDKTHLRFFTRKSILEMFGETGYTVDYISGIRPARSRMLEILNKISFGYFEEFRYLQYSVIAKPRIDE